MYGPNQIIFDLDLKKPVRIGHNVWDPDSYPKRHTHFIKSSSELTGKRAPGGLFLEFVELACPRSIEEAEDLLAKGIIVPAPCSPDHCWKCGNWKSNCAEFKTCDEWGNSKKDQRS